MYKFMVIICSLILIGSLSAHTPAKKMPQKQRFDWKKAEGERRKVREKFREEYKKYVAALKEYHKRYTEAKTEDEKNKIRVELNEFLTKDFNRKIEHSKKRVNDMKKFVARLEEEQKKMEAKAPEFIKKRTDEILQGEIMPKWHKKNKK